MSYWTPEKLDDKAQKDADKSRVKCPRRAIHGTDRRKRAPENDHQGPSAPGKRGGRGERH